MNDEVDRLRRAVGADTDLALASELGLERSTIAQWRRRGALPQRYREILDAERVGERRGLRRKVYGDGAGRYLLSAALGVIPTAALDLPMELSEANVGWSRETLLMNVVEVVLSVAAELFGKAVCDNDDDFVRLMRALEEPEHRLAISHALARAVVGEL